ncbi:MAG: ATP synthase subunit a [Parcubacteria group bacterium GW2011_GWA2_43_11]|nr:MAG: ATP synthase subunit a [Parcubacteria group bacterium GW2011_GWA2_43_11]
MEGGIHIALKAEQIVHVWGIPITNTMLMSWLVMLVLIVCGYVIGKKLQKIPSKAQTFFETLFSFLLDYFEEVLESRELARRFFPLITTFFLFILLGNWFGLIPGVGSVFIEHSEPVEAYEESGVVVGGDVLEEETVKAETHETTQHIALFHPVSVDLNFTLALAIISFFIVEVSGVMYVGALHYASKFINLRSPVGFLVGLIELLSEVARLVSFSFRLFGNMFAGKTLILVAMFFVPLILPVPLMLYEVFVGFIQASIFSLLTLFFVKLAISEAH